MPSETAELDEVARAEAAVAATGARSGATAEDDGVQVEDGDAALAAEGHAATRLAGWRAAARKLCRSRLVWIVVPAGAIVVALGGMLVVLQTARGREGPWQTLVRALNELDGGNRGEAYRLATELRARNLRIAEFPGGPDFVLGVAMAQELEELLGESAEEVASSGDHAERTASAIYFLRRAERNGLAAERRGEWAFWLGFCLVRTGEVDESRPLLSEASETYAARRREATLLLVETYMAAEPPEYGRALEINARAAGAFEAAGARDAVLLQRIRILLALGRTEDASAALRALSAATAAEQAAQVLLGRIAMGRGDYEAALATLRRVADRPRLQRTASLEARYLAGLCRLALGEREAALAEFEGVQRRAPESREGIASGFRAAELHRGLGRDEEALGSYRMALGGVRECAGPFGDRSAGLRNPWIDGEEARGSLRAAWQAWCEAGRYDLAVQLAEAAPPVWSVAEACEYAARAERGGAEQLEAEAARSAVSHRTTARNAERESVQEAWWRVGRAYLRLAESRARTPLYAEDLWNSASAFFAAGDYARAAEVVRLHLRETSGQGAATAAVLLGRSLLGLGEVEQALAVLVRCTEEHPTDHASFAARVLIGHCHAELGQVDEAEQTWLGIVQSAQLDPTSREWLQATQGLGRLYHQQGRWEDAVASLREAIARRADGAESAELRYLLADALQRRAEELRGELQAAAPESARQGGEAELAERLASALDEFEHLRAELAARGRETLSPLEAAILRNCYFDRGDCLLALGRDRDAIAAYEAAAERYQDRPEAIAAYAQIAACYRRLGMEDEARGMGGLARVTLDRMPEEAFEDGASALTRSEWQEWLGGNDE